MALLLQAVPAGVYAQSTNAPPTFLGGTGDKSVAEKDLLHFEVYVTDPDGDPVTLDGVDIPAGAVFQDNGTLANGTTIGYFSWTPSYDAQGTYTIKVVARDMDQSSNTSAIDIEVTNVNRAPYVAMIRPQSVNELENLNVQLSATDLDGDDLSWDVEVIPTPDYPSTVLPSGVHVDSGAAQRGAFEWTPDCTRGSETGARYQFKVIADDGFATHSRQFNVTVFNVDVAPELNEQPWLRKAIEGDFLSFKITGAACDVEDHFLDVGLEFAAPAGIAPPKLPPAGSSGLPAGVVIDREDPDPMYEGVDEYFSWFNWTIHQQQAGNYTFWAEMRDANNNTDRIEFVIVVDVENTPPVFGSLPAFHDPANDTYYHKEDTRFHMTAPLGSYTGEGCTFRALAVPCGTPWIATVDDFENDKIFFEFEWTHFNGERQNEETILPPGLSFIAPGTNPETGGPGNAPDEAREAFATFAMIRWIPTYADAGSYQFNLSATDGLNVTWFTFQVDVENTNQRPEIFAISDRTVPEGEEVIIDILGIDLDFVELDEDLRDSHELWVGTVAGGTNDLPGGALFVSGRKSGTPYFTGTLQWTPGYHQAGHYELTAFVDDSDPDRLFPNNPLGTGNEVAVGVELVNPPHEPTPWNFPGFFGRASADAWTEFYDLEDFNITVTNVDRAPQLDPISDVEVWFDSGSFSTPLSALDLDGDPITLNVSGLPAFASLTDFGDGTGVISGSTSVSDVGVYDIDVSACAGLPENCDVESFTLSVFSDNDFSLSVQNTLKTSPGEPKNVTVTVTNHGPAADSIGLTLSFPDGTNGTIEQPPSLAAGASATVNATILVAPGTSGGIVRVVGVSGSDPTLSKNIPFSVITPINLAVAMIDTTPSAIRGTVTATFLNGDPVVLSPVAIVQSPSTNPFGAASTQTGGYTGLDGVHEFSWGRADASSSLPGQHSLDISLSYGGRTYTAQSSYTV